MTEQNSIIDVQDVSLAFGEETVLSHVSHRFERGKIHGITGCNGSGKTVLIKCICGFLRPTAGRIFVDGKEIGRDADFPDDIGIIIETPGFLPELSGKKNLKLLASLRRRADDAAIEKAMELVGLDPCAKKKVGKYSLGMRQKLALAQAIMENPHLLILDEPFNALDRQSAAHMRDLLKSLRNEGKTILLISHISSDIEALCDTVCEMDGGSLTPL